MKLFEPAKPWLIRTQLSWTALWLFCTGMGLYMKPDLHGHGTHQQLGLPPCPSVLLFDRPCPGCGLTTSWTNLLHGNILESFRNHPLGPIMYLGLAFIGIAALYGNIKGLRFMTDAKVPNTVFVSFVAVFFTFGLARMYFSPGFAGTDKEKIWRSAIQAQKPQPKAETSVTK